MDFNDFKGIWKVSGTEGNPRCSSADPCCIITISGTEEAPMVNCRNRHLYLSPSYHPDPPRIVGVGYILTRESQRPGEKPPLKCTERDQGLGETGSWTAEDDRPWSPPLS